MGYLFIIGYMIAIGLTIRTFLKNRRKHLKKHDDLNNRVN